MMKKTRGQRGRRKQRDIFNDPKLVGMMDEILQDMLDPKTADVASELVDIVAQDHGPQRRRGQRGRSKATLDLIATCSEIIKQVQPITVRGVCYRLFVAGHIDSMAVKNTQKISRLLVQAREEGLIPWEWIVDDSRHTEREPHWTNLKEYAGAIQRSEFSTPATDTSETPDPASLTPTGGSKDYLWLAVSGGDNASLTVDSYPANYSNGEIHGGAGGSAQGYIAIARRNLRASSEDPGTFDMSSATEEWNAVTVAIYPKPARPIAKPIWLD